MDETTSLINRALDEVRRAESLNETDLGPRFNVHQTTIWRWRNGQKLCLLAQLIPFVYRLDRPASDQTTTPKGVAP